MLKATRRVVSRFNRSFPNIQASKRLSTLSDETLSLPTRNDMLKRLQKETEYDILIVGGGATGAGDFAYFFVCKFVIVGYYFAGAALDASSRGLKVACVEREDFASGTSSRSTKLIWGGSRYLVQALVKLFSLDGRLLTSPRSTINSFLSEFRMVLNCHRERKFLLEQQNHLTAWLPIAVPLTRWVLWPPPFHYLPAALGPLGLFPLFFKLYDALSGFAAPPSHIMTAARTQRKFPQLAVQGAAESLKYCTVFYEGMHDDARTNLAIAQTAALHGADIANYCEVVSFLRGTGTGAGTERIDGAVVCDTVTGREFTVRAKSVLLCGGPLTDTLRQLEDPAATPAVTGAAGVHIVLPGYFAPRHFGLVDMNTSDGRFLFLLPWRNHVLIGTTDHPAAPTATPVPSESEIKWLLQEASKYIAAELRLRREDVLSAWCGIRPLATDPHCATPLSSTSAVSRDHVVSHNPRTGLVFVSGGKWTTYREMAEDAIDRMLEVHADRLPVTRLKRCHTLALHLLGHRHYSPHLHIRLIQDYRLPPDIAEHLVATYAGRAEDVLRLAAECGMSCTQRLLPESPFLEAEVLFALRYEWCVHAQDFLCRRIRLAFLHRDAAIRTLPRVIDLMAGELAWTPAQRQTETTACLAYLRQFGGPQPFAPPAPASSSAPVIRSATQSELQEAFGKVDVEAVGVLSRTEIPLLCEVLQHPLSAEEIDSLLSFACSQYHAPLGCVNLPAFAAWWNSEQYNPGLAQLKSEAMAKIDAVQGSGTLFG